MFNFQNCQRIDTRPDIFAKGFAPLELVNAWHGLTADPVQDALLMECAGSPDEMFRMMDEEYNPGEVDDEAMREQTILESARRRGYSPQHIFEAVRVKAYGRTGKTMLALSRVLNRSMADKSLTVGEAIIGKPKKSGLFATVTVQLPISDGQVITIIFHSPDAQKKNITATDEILAFKWMLNKRDITVAVSPEGKADISLDQVGKRIAMLIERNSARFQKSQKDVAEQRETLSTTTVELVASQDIIVKGTEALASADKEIEDVSNSQINLNSSLAAIQAENATLEAKLTELQTLAKANEGKGKPAAGKAPKEPNGDGYDEAFAKTVQVDVNGSKIAGNLQDVIAGKHNDNLDLALEYTDAANTFFSKPEAKEGYDQWAKDAIAQAYAIIERLRVAASKSAPTYPPNVTQVKIGDRISVDGMGERKYGTVSAMILDTGDNEYQGVKFLDEYTGETIGARWATTGILPAPFPDRVDPTEPARTEYLRLRAISEEQVPGVRAQDQEETGRMYELYYNEQISFEEWNKYVIGLINENRTTGYFLYGMMSRPFDRNALPKDPSPKFFDATDKRGSYGVVAFPARLTPEQVNHFSLLPIGDSWVGVERTDADGEATPPPAPEVTAADTTPAPSPFQPGEEDAILLMNDLIAGNYDEDIFDYNRKLNDIAELFERLGLMEKYDIGLNSAADHYTELLAKA